MAVHLCFSLRKVKAILYVMARGMGHVTGDMTDDIMGHINPELRIACSKKHSHICTVTNGGWVT